MDWDQVKNNWTSFAGELRSKWGKLTPDDLESFDGTKGFLVTALERRYGIRKDHAEMQVDRWLSQLKEPKNFDSSVAASPSADGNGRAQH